MDYFFKVRIFLIFLAFSACTNKHEDPSNIISFNSEAEARKTFESVTIECDEKDLNCPESVAGVSFLIHDPDNPEGPPWYTVVCSGTLISHNKVLTNDHCLRNQNFKENDSCVDKIKVFFPKTKNNDAEKFECAKIHKINSQKRGYRYQRPDWVILELKNSTERKPAPLSSEGLNENKMVKSYPIYYEKVDQEFKGKARSNTCTSTMSHFYSTYFFHPHSSIITAANCSLEVIPGNSGAGYFNENNELQFIGSFSVKPDKDSNTQTLYSYGNDFKINTKFVGGTNIACMEAFNPSRSPFCFFSANLNFIFLLNEIRFTFHSPSSFSKLKEEKIKANKENFPHIQWEKTTKKSNFYFYVLNQFNTKYNQKSESKLFEYLPIPQEIMEYLSLKVAEYRYPQTPVCITPNNADNNEVEIPYIHHNNFETKIDKTGQVINHFEYDPIKVDWIKSDPQTYKAELLRMSPSQKSEYFKKEAEMIAQLRDCESLHPNSPLMKAVTEKAIKNPCIEYREKKSALKKWMTENNFPQYLVRNEMMALELKDKEFGLELPICSHSKRNSHPRPLDPSLRSG